MFLSPMLLSGKKSLVEMFEGKSGNKFVNQTSGLHIC